MGRAKCTCGVLGQLVGVIVPAYFSPLWGGVDAKPRDDTSFLCFFILLGNGGGGGGVWLKVAMFSFVAEFFLFLSKGMRWGGLVFKFRLSYWEYESAALRGKFALANLIAYFFDVWLVR